MVTFNSSVNLFIYCGFGKKFRREFKKLLGLKVDTIEVGKREFPGIFKFGSIEVITLEARNYPTEVLEKEANQWKRNVRWRKQPR